MSDHGLKEPKYTRWFWMERLRLSWLRAICASFLLCLAFIALSFKLAPTFLTHRPRDGARWTKLKGTSSGDVLASLYTSDELIYFTTGQLPQGIGTNLASLDRGLADYIRSHIARPSGRRPILEQDKDQHERMDSGRARTLDKLFNNRRGGFFIECGAADGEYLSNSLFFELNRAWTGLLIEADPNQAATLLGRRRNAFVLPTCLSPTPNPSALTFTISEIAVAGGLKTEMSEGMQKALKAKSSSERTLTCFPLNTVLAAINVNRVDYLSLDVEGAELSILKTIDYNRTWIDVIFAEYADPTSTHDKLDRLNALREFFNSTRLYKEVMLLPEGTTKDIDGIDVLFRRIK